MSSAPMEWIGHLNGEIVHYLYQTKNVFIGLVHYIDHQFLSTLCSLTF